MNLIVFFLLFGSFCLLFGLHRKDFRALLSFMPKPSMKRRIAKAQKVSESFFARQLAESKQILAVYSIPGGIWLFYFSSLILSALALGFSTLVQNLFIAPILMAALSALPFVLLKLYWLYKEKQMNETLEIALNSITSSYLRSSGSIVQAIEENISQLPSPINDIFKHFLLQTTYVDASIVDALDSMKLSVHNTIFHQWIDVLIQAESNHKMKENLPKILDKFSDAKAIQLEVGVILSDAKRTYLYMFFLSLFAPFVLYFINQHWWNIMVTTVGGKICVMLYLLGVFISVIAAYKAYRQSQGGISV